MGVRQLQQNAATAVRRVRKGERIEVTDRGRPVALLVPVTHESVLDGLDAAGRLSRAEGDALDVSPIRLPRGAEAPSRRLARVRAAER
jgi:prevent-host-death family protein